MSPRHPHAVIGEAAPKIAKDLMREREKDNIPSFNYRGDADKRKDDRKRVSLTSLPSHYHIPGISVNKYFFLERCSTEDCDGNEVDEEDCLIAG